jgi:uncharacterized protein
MRRLKALYPLTQVAQTVYTKVATRVFNWDEDNVIHVALHGVTTIEVEEALLDPRRIGAPAEHAPTERRYGAIGSTEDGGVLAVVFTKRRGAIRPITARDLTPAERRRYRRR